MCAQNISCSLVVGTFWDLKQNYDLYTLKHTSILMHIHKYINIYEYINPFNNRN